MRKRNTLHSSGLATEIKPPTYHRQRLLLFLLEQAGSRLSKTDLQKLLFLYIEEADKKHYAFVPYRFGCYSFLAVDDLELLHNRGWIEQGNKHVELRVSLTKQPWAKENLERKAVRRWLSNNTKRGAALIQDVYRRYPWYAIRSEIKEQILSADELVRIREVNHREQASIQILFTLGYEGLHFEEYINKLIHNDVKLVCDVRRNPLSRKFGFSQRILATLLPKMGIKYQHIPELGIELRSRKNLHTIADYEELFAEYRETLPDREDGLDRVMKSLDNQKRIALTCFEEDPYCCHRHCVSDFLAKQYRLTVIHL